MRPLALPTHTTITSPGPHVLNLDYTNNSAQIMDVAGRCIAIYSGVSGRADAAVRIAADGWHLCPGSDWTYTSPPDGRQHPVCRTRATRPVAFIRPSTTHAAPGPQPPSCPADKEQP